MEWVVSDARTRVDVVTMLLEANAEVNASRKDGVSPLHIAAQNGHRHVCQLLMANPHGEKGFAQLHAARTARTHAPHARTHATDDYGRQPR